MRPYQIGTTAAIVAIAAVAMFETRGVFTQHLGSSPGDVGPYWYPFWSAAVMGAASLFVGYRAFAAPASGEVAFEGRASLISVLKLVIPMSLYAFSFRWLGFYIATFVYMGFFAAYLGRYRWSALAAAVATPLAIYLLFEVGFRLVLPKSILYTTLTGFPF